MQTAGRVHSPAPACEIIGALADSPSPHLTDSVSKSLVQVGLAEMKNVVELSGGLVIQTDSFGNSVFKDSFRNLLSGPEESRSVSLASNAIFEVRRAAPPHPIDSSTGVVAVTPALQDYV